MNPYERARTAGKDLLRVVPNKINRILNEIAEEIDEQSDKILAANTLDLAKISDSDPNYDLLYLNTERLEKAASELRDVAAQPTPLGKILSSTKRPNEMIITKVSTPFGVVGVIYETRPSFTFDSFALCLKSGNAVVLKSSFEAHFTNTAIVKLIKEVLTDNGINSDTITLLSPERDTAIEMLHANDYIDLVIPRGDKQLVQFVRENSHIPFIETGRGVCHTYIDSEADTKKAASIVHNAKTRFPIACNSLDCVIIHKDRLDKLVEICKPLAESNVTIYADEPSFEILESTYPSIEPATKEHYSTEFVDYKMVIKTVNNLNEALNHIARYSSKNSEAIITENADTAKQFLAEVDAASVYHNVSTAFTDGSEYGMGAEIGISTQKFGARGPLALPELTTYKYIITGDSQIRK